MLVEEITVEFDKYKRPNEKHAKLEEVLVGLKLISPETLKVVKQQSSRLVSEEVSLAVKTVDSERKFKEEQGLDEQGTKKLGRLFSVFSVP